MTGTDDEPQEFPSHLLNSASVNELADTQLLITKECESTLEYGQDVFDSDQLMSEDVRSDWLKIFAGDTHGELFAASYDMYIRNPEQLRREAAELYEFLKRYVFGGIEYLHNVPSQSEVLARKELT